MKTCNDSPLNIQEEKKSIRKAYKVLRNKLDYKYIENRSSIIFNKLLKIVDIKKLDTICIYDSFSNEVSTKRIIEYSLKNNIKVSLPIVMDDKNIKLKYIKDYDKDINRNTKFGNGEPLETCEDCPIEKVELFIIPALVFDEYCGRIGFGKGYYDNLLKKNVDALRIGICYDYQIAPRLPKDFNDEILDIIISEKKVITALF